MMRPRLGARAGTTRARLGARAAALASALAVVSALGVPAARGDGAPAFRWSRPVQSQPGWIRVELPDDVLSACRTGLPDLRVRAADGHDVPYAYDDAIGTTPPRWPVRDVESVPGKETTAIVDRGANPGPAAEATIRVDATEFLKPVVLEASDDGKTWREIARGSIFAAGGVRQTTLRFAPNDRRWWRVRLDDRNGAAVTPQSLETIAVPASPAVHDVTLPVRLVSSESGTSTYEVTLPGANMTIVALHLAPSDAVFSRRVRVLERVLFRDEVTRRELGEANVTRGPGVESLAVAVGASRSAALGIEIDDGASPPLTIDHVTATVKARSVLLNAEPSALPLTLDYGSPTATAPRYDVAAALSAGPPPAVLATLGAAVDRGGAPAVTPPPRGPAVDEARWEYKRAIDLPAGSGNAGGGVAGSGVAWLALDGIDPAAGLRIVDASSQQVPFVFEGTPHPTRTTASTRVQHAAGRTTITPDAVAAFGQVDAVELSATAPDYFAREVTAVEVLRDARGPTEERVLGEGHWERQPGEVATPWTLPIAAPTQATFDVRIDDGDNAPLTVATVALLRRIPRIDFVYAPGDAMFLLTGDPSAPAPHYDLALVADALLASPAEPAGLEPARSLAPAHGGASSGPPQWFWACVIVAGLLVAAALARALGTKTDRPTT